MSALDAQVASLSVGKAPGAGCGSRRRTIGEAVVRQSRMISGTVWRTGTETIIVREHLITHTV
jgi:hypothetical protein